MEIPGALYQDANATEPDSRLSVLAANIHA